MRCKAWLVFMIACGGGASKGGDAGVDGAMLDAPRVPSPDGAIDAMADAAVPDAAVLPILPDVLPAATCSGTVMLPGIPAIDVGRLPNRSTLADLDGDGDLDIATVSSSREVVAVQLGAGDGTFAASAEYAVTGSPRPLANGDVDGDGDRDLVLVSATPGAIVVLRNDGAGQFSTRVTSTTVADTGLLAIEDVDGDGDLDAVTVHRITPFSYAVAVQLNDGAGTFGAVTTYAAGFEPIGLVLVDLDADGDRDIVMANKEGKDLGVLRNLGTGTFAPLASTPLNYKLLALGIGDLDEDGKLDAVVATVNGGTRLARGLGNGTFAASTQIHPTSLGRLAVADMDGDAHLDVIGLGVGLETLPGLGTGAFGPARFVQGQYEAQLQVGRINGDARPDVVLTLYGAGAVEILIADATGGLRLYPTYQVGVGQFAGVSSVVAADFDGNNGTDLAVIAGEGTSFVLQLYLANGTSTMTPVTAAAMGYARSLVAADFGSNGRVDLLTADTVYWNTPMGWAAMDLGVATSAPIHAFAADLNADGLPDLVLSGNLAWSVRLATSATTFGAVIPGDSSQIVAVAASDLNGDGMLDLLSRGQSDASSELRLGNGNGTFQAPTAVIGTVPADFDGDGRGDLAGLTGLARGNGDGTFQPVVPYGIGLDYYVDHRPVDFDRDGKLDVLALDGYGGMSLLRGNGDGTFQPRTIYGTGGQRTSFALLDHDRDGRLDVITSGYGRDLTLMLQGCK